MTDTAQPTADADAVAAQAAALAASSGATTITDPAVKTEADVAATPEKPVVVVPETYDLKLPDGSTLDPAIVERTAATARALGLSNEAGQTLLDQTVEAETKRAEDAATAQQTLVDSWKPGGTAWIARNAEWTKQAQADPELGKTPAEFTATLEKSQQALAKYGPELKAYLDETGLGSHPAAIKFLAKVGRAMSEGSLVLGSPSNAGKPKTEAERHYAPDGGPKDGGVAA